MHARIYHKVNVAIRGTDNNFSRALSDPIQYKDVCGEVHIESKGYLGKR